MSEKSDKQDARIARQYDPKHTPMLPFEGRMPTKNDPNFPSPSEQRRQNFQAKMQANIQKRRKQEADITNKPSAAPGMTHGEFQKGQARKKELRAKMRKDKIRETDGGGSGSHSDQDRDEQGRFA